MNLDTVLPVLLPVLLPILLTVQGVLGGVDTLINHELVERLPSRPDARREIGLHALREAIYGVLFCGLAWRAWLGWAALVILALLAAEIAVTACDEYVENRTRVLPQNERVLHVFLTLNFGALVALLVPLSYGWLQQPYGLPARDFGAWSWMLTALGAASLCWSIRDLLAWRRLKA